MNEGSTSRLYSFNIYLKSNVVYYNRSYKKLSLIIAEGLPIVNIIFLFFRLITKIFKISSANKKLTELLFENIIYLIKYSYFLKYEKSHNYQSPLSVKFL